MNLSIIKLKNCINAVKIPETALKKFKNYFIYQIKYFEKKIVGTSHFF